MKSRETDNINAYPFKEDAKVLSLSPHGTNIKERYVYCKKCKYQTITSLAGPVCHTCNENLITVNRIDLANKSNKTEKNELDR